MFTAAFSVEIFTSSRQVWVILTVGIALAMMILPISWGVWATFEARAGFSVLSRINFWKTRLYDFTRGDPEAGVKDDEGWDGQRKVGKPRRSRTLKEVFNSMRRPLREKASTSSKRHLAGSNGPCSSPGTLGVEDEINGKEQGSVV